jgi:hypothetical protein
LVMETKDYVYLGLIVMTGIIFYWHGYLAARLRARKSIAAIFNDSRSVMELPAAEEDTALTPRSVRAPTPRKCRGRKIRAVFGVN